MKINYVLKSDAKIAVELKIVPYEDVQEQLLKEFDEGKRKKIENDLAKKEWFRVNFARLSVSDNKNS